MFRDVLQNNCPCKFYRKAHVLEYSFIILQTLRTATLWKRDFNSGFFLWILWITQKHLFCVEDLSSAGSETPVCLCRNILFCRTSPVTVSDSFRFPACNSIKKETPAKTYFCEFCKIFKNIFGQNTSDWLLLVFICESWEIFQVSSFIQHLWETAHFMYKLKSFNHRIQ